MSPPIVRAVPGGRPELRFRRPGQVPNGPWRALALANAALVAGSVPGPDAPWETVQDFALSYDGYRYWTDVAELAKRAYERWTRQGLLPVNLDELRGCLFYEQRRSHHAGREPMGRQARYVAALLGAIGVLLEVPAVLDAPAAAERSA